MRRSLTVIFIISFGVVFSASAQQVPVSPNCNFDGLSGDCLFGRAVLNPFRLDEEKGRVSDNRSLFNSGLEVSSMTKVLESNGYHQMDSNPNQWCRMNANGTTQECVIQDSTDERLMNTFDENQKQRLNLISMQGPVSTFVDTMDEEIYGSIISNTVASDSAVVFTTLNLVEPAVMGGLANAMNQTSHFVSQRDQHTRTMMEQAENDPQMAYFVRNQYLNCVSRRLRDTNGLFRTTPLQAQLACMPDRNDTTILDPTAGSIGLGNTFRLSDHPSHPSHATGALPMTPRQNETILLTDMMFNQKAWEHGGAVGLESPGWRSLDRYKAGWRQLYGDLEFELIPHCLQYANAANRVCTPGFENYAAQDLEIEYIEPEGPPITNPGINTIGGGEWYYRALTKLIWTLMYWGQEMLCHFNNGQYWDGSSWQAIMASGEPDPYALYRSGTQGAQSGDFWDDPDFWQGLTVMSLRGFRMTPPIFESIFYLFQRDEEARIDSSANLQCNLLDAINAGGASNFDNLMDSISCPGGNCLEETISLRHRATFFLSSKIALGQLLGTHIQAQKMVQELLDGDANAVVREHAMRLIYRQAGTNDLFGAYEANLQQIRAFIDELFALRARESGGTGRIGGAFAEPGIQSSFGRME